MTSNHSTLAPAPASTPTRTAPRPTLEQRRDAAADEMARSGYSPEVIDAALYAPIPAPMQLAPRPVGRVYPAWSLCQSCGGEYYPEDIPAELADVGQYGTCTDCRAEAVTDMAAWVAGVWS